MLLRELVEESGQLGRVVDLLGVNNLHKPGRARTGGTPGWTGTEYGAVYRVMVDAPTEPAVIELAGGSTAVRVAPSPLCPGLHPSRSIGR